MKTNKRKIGISLIVLIITIIVVIILAAVVILTLSKNNPIESAKEASFKEDVRTFQDELAMYISKEYAQDGGKRDTKINADKYTKDGAEDSVYTYISSFKNIYNSKFVIEDDQLKYTKKVSQKEIDWLNNLNISKSLALLPIDYQQVEYIECTGSQYIDTEYVFKNHPKVVGEIRISSTANGDIMGNPIANSSCFIVNSDNGRIYYRYSSSSHNNKIVSGINTENWYKFEFSDTIKMNGNEVLSVDSYDFSNNTQTFFIGKGRTYGCAKFKEIKMYDGDELVRDLIPCYQKETFISGMYDVENDKFYSSESDIDFYYPKTFTSNEDCELEYIGCIGEQYINSEYVFKNHPKIVGEISIISKTNSDIMGNLTANSSCFIVNSDGGRIYYRYSSSAHNNKIVSGINTENWYDFEFSDKIKMNGNEVLSVDSYDFSSNNQTFFIGKGRMYGYVKFKEIEMYDGDEMVRDFVPYYKKDINKVGMLDKVHNIFYTNQGTGEDFYPGPKKQ